MILLGSKARADEIKLAVGCGADGIGTRVLIESSPKLDPTRIPKPPIISVILFCGRVWICSDSGDQIATRDGR